MQIGGAVVGNTTVGFSSTKQELSLSASGLSSLTGTPTTGYNLVFASSATSTAVINNKINLTYTATGTGTATFGSTKGVNLSYGVVGPDVGGVSLGETQLGAEVGEPFNSTSSIDFGSTKGVSQTFTASANSNLAVNRRVDLVLESIAQSTTTINVIKGVEVRYDARTDTSLILVPDFDEIIGRTRADCDRTLIIRADANLN